MPWRCRWRCRWRFGLAKRCRWRCCCCRWHCRWRGRCRCHGVAVGVAVGAAIVTASGTRLVRPTERYLTRATVSLKPLGCSHRDKTRSGPLFILNRGTGAGHWHRSIQGYLCESMHWCRNGLFNDFLANRRTGAAPVRSVISLRIQAWEMRTSHWIPSRRPSCVQKRPEQDRLNYPKVFTIIHKTRNMTLGGSDQSVTQEMQSGNVYPHDEQDAFSTSVRARLSCTRVERGLVCDVAVDTVLPSPKLRTSEGLGMMTRVERTADREVQRDDGG